MLLLLEFDTFLECPWNHRGSIKLNCHWPSLVYWVDRVENRMENHWIFWNHSKTVLWLVYNRDRGKLLNKSFRIIQSYRRADASRTIFVLAPNIIETNRLFGKEGSNRWNGNDIGSRSIFYQRTNAWRKSHYNHYCGNQFQWSTTIAKAENFLQQISNSLETVRFGAKLVTTVVDTNFWSPKNSIVQPKLVWTSLHMVDKIL